MSSSEIRRGLSSRLEALRIRTLEDLARRGAAADADALRLVEEIAAGPDGRAKAWAQAALMRIEGSRRFLRDLAEHAARSPVPDVYDDVIRLVDPAAGGALIRTAKALAERSATSQPAGVEDLDAALTALAADPKTGGEIVARAARAASGAEQAMWLDVAAGVRPLPTDVSMLMAERIRGVTPDAADEPFGYVLQNRDRIDLSAAAPELHAALASHMDNARDPLRGASMRALGRLKKVSPATIEQIVRAARDGEQASYDALIALRDLGEQARPYVQQMIDLEASLSATSKFLLAQALLAVGGEGVGAYAARRIAQGDPRERAAWFEGAQALARVPDASQAMDALAAASRTWHAPTSDELPLGTPPDARPPHPVSALATMDPSASRGATADAVALALEDPQPERRLEGLRAVAALTSLPARVGGALARVAATPDEAVRSAARKTIANGWRFGSDAKPLVDAALALIDATGADAPSPELSVGLLRTIGAGDPDAPAARARLRTAVLSAAPDERVAGVYGLSRLSTPTAEEKAAVRAATSDPLERVRDIATKVLALPAWK